MTTTTTETKTEHVAKVYFHTDITYSHYVAVVVELPTEDGKKLFFSFNEKNRVKCYHSYPRPYWRIKSLPENLHGLVIDDDKKRTMKSCVLFARRKLYYCRSLALKFDKKIGADVIDETTLYLVDMYKNFDGLFEAPSTDLEGWEPLKSCNDRELLDKVLRFFSEKKGSVYTDGDFDFRYENDKIYFRRNVAEKETLAFTEEKEKPAVPVRKSVKMALCKNADGVENLTLNMLYNINIDEVKNGYIPVIDDFGNERFMAVERFVFVDVYCDAINSRKEVKHEVLG